MSAGELHAAFVIAVEEVDGGSDCVEGTDEADVARAGNTRASMSALPVNVGFSTERIEVGITTHYTLGERTSAKFPLSPVNPPDRIG